MGEYQNGRVSAIIVTYNPDVERLNCIINNIVNQVSTVIVVDNSDEKMPRDIIEKVKYIHLGGNKGIAYAQNIGFLEAYNSSEFIITFDQDSNVSSDLITSLVKEYNYLLEVGVANIACIGPTVVNERSGEVYEKYFNNSYEISPGCFSVKSIISSGTLYPVESFSYIGLNKANWFIDSIDIEWCYRARYLGYKVVMTRNVVMKHNLGSGDKRLIGGKKINFGSPIRLYYVYRNWIFSLREPQFPLRYKIKIIFFMPIKFFIFSTIHPRRLRIYYMLKGIVAGLFNNKGGGF